MTKRIDDTYTFTNAYDLLAFLKGFSTSQLQTMYTVNNKSGYDLAVGYEIETLMDGSEVVNLRFGEIS